MHLAAVATEIGHVSIIPSQVGSLRDRDEAAIQLLACRIDRGLGCFRASELRSGRTDRVASRATTGGGSVGLAPYPSLHRLRGSPSRQRAISTGRHESWRLDGPETEELLSAGRISRRRLLVCPPRIFCHSPGRTWLRRCW